MGIFYATREQIMRSLEVLDSAYAGSLIDAKIDSSSRSIEGLLHRRMYPELRTIRKDWPSSRYGTTWQVDLSDQEIISLTSVVSGGTTITSNVILRRGDDLAEPPYSMLQIDLSSNASFSGNTTFQRSLVIAGIFGGDKDTDTSLAGGLVHANINSSVATMVIDPSSGLYTAGIGSLIMVGTERMLLVNSQMVTSGQTISADITAQQSSRLVLSGGASTFAKGEIILIDSERMMIDDIAGNGLIVRRAWDGTALSAHTDGATIYVLRQFTVRRGALGSTAASHTLGDSVYVHEYPALVNELCVAETVCALEQNAGAYARTIGSGGATREAVGGGLQDVREACRTAYGRRSRSAVI